MKRAKFKIEFDDTGVTFSALYKAQVWLRQFGFSAGSMCSNAPTAIKFGDWHIAKWRNLSNSEQRDIDGIMTSADWRNGSVQIELEKSPDEYGSLASRNHS